jgi:predicted DNA-binding protein
MASSKKISFDIEVKSLKKLDEIAIIADRPRAYILNELIADFLDDLAGFYIASLRLKGTPESEYTPIGKAWEMVQQKRDGHGSNGKR